MSIDRVSANLRAIADMAKRLERRAVDRADDKLMPGGEAMVNLAPVGSSEYTNNRRDAWERWVITDGDYERDWDRNPYIDDPEETWPAVTYLRFWTEQWRRELGQDWDDFTYTLETEVKFLMNPDVLAWAWSNELHWDDFAGDVERAKAKVENILREGERADRIRVACPDCTKANAEANDGEGNGQQAPRLVTVYGLGDDEDRWKCPTCRHKFTLDEVRRAGASQRQAAGIAQRWLPVPDAVLILRTEGGWREKTIRSWIEDATEVSRKREGMTNLVWWPDVWRMHLLHRWEINELRRKEAERELRKAACADEHGPDCWRHGRGCSRVLAGMTAV